MWKVSTAVAAKRGRTRGSTPLERSSWDSTINSSRSGMLGPGLPLAPFTSAGLLLDAQPRADLPTTAQEVRIPAHFRTLLPLIVIILE